PAPPPSTRREPMAWSHYFWAGLVVIVCGLFGWLSKALGHPEANIVIGFLAGIALVAYRFGRGPAIAAAIASVLTFDFFFVPPVFTFTVDDLRYVITFAGMFILGVAISALTSRIRDQLRAAKELESRTAALFRLTKQLSEISGQEFLVHAAGQQLKEI